MTRTRLPMILLVLSLAPTASWAWSSQGHQAIAEAAQARLSPKAQSALAQILQCSVTLAPGALAGVATWPDDIRARAAYGTVAPGWSQADKDEADASTTITPPTRAGTSPWCPRDHREQNRTCGTQVLPPFFVHACLACCSAAP